MGWLEACLALASIRRQAYPVLSLSKDQPERHTYSNKKIN